MTRFRTSYFTDYAGVRHYFTVCATILKPDYLGLAGGLNSKDNPDCYETVGSFSANDLVKKVVSIGVAICNPTDEFSITVGETLALTNAKDYNCKKKWIATNVSGFITNEFLEFLLTQEVEFIKNNPGAYIKGYSTMKNNYEQKQLCKDIYNNLDDIDKAFINKIRDDQSLDVLPYLIRLFNKHNVR